MQCPECGNEMQKGVVEIRDSHLLLPQVMVRWCPEEEKKKLFKKNAISLSLNAEGYYCDTCMKVVAIFDERIVPSIW